MGEGSYSSEPFDEETRHKQAIWEEFKFRSVEAANKSIEWLELQDIDPGKYDFDQIEAIYRERWGSTGDVVISVLNFVWPEIESMAVKLGIPFEPEISEIDEDQDGTDY